jgi:RimJ/RimL family protein N-acetyltransferase
MRTGEVYGNLALGDGREIVLRALFRGDLSKAVTFANTLVRERSSNKDLGTLLDRRVTRREEKRWLDLMLSRIKRGDVFSVAAFHHGRLVGNSEIHRQRFKDLRHSGTLGIAILDGYRGVGLGRRMLEHLLDVALEGGVSLVELRVLSINRIAIRLYRSLGFGQAGMVPGKIIRGGRRIDEILMFRQA